MLQFFYLFLPSITISLLKKSAVENMAVVI